MPDRGAVRRWTERLMTSAPWAALLIGLGLTAWAWSVVHERALREAQAEFDRQAVGIADAIQQRMLAYELLLRGGAGLFAGAADPSRNDWRAYVGALDLERTVPGVEGVGYAVSVSPRELAGFEARVRAEGFAQFSVYPAGPRDAYSAILYLEPFAGRNLLAFGYDMYSETQRRAAMDRARDRGQPSLSARVTLVQEGGESTPQYGALLYVPVYERGMPLSTIEERRAALRGWSYGAFRIRDLLSGIIHAPPPDLRLTLHDGWDADSPMFESSVRVAGHVPSFSRTIAVTVADHTWSLHADSTPAFEQRTNLREPRRIAATGALGSLLVFAIAWSLASTRSRALSLADRMTLALRDANESLERRIEERTASLAHANRQLEDENRQRQRAESEREIALRRERDLAARLQAVTGTAAMLASPSTLQQRLQAIADRAREVLDAQRALVILRDEPAGRATAHALSYDANDRRDDVARWRDAMLVDVSGARADTLRAALLDSAGRSRGAIALWRSQGEFCAEDGIVLTQLAVLAASAIALDEVLARERQARSDAERANRAKDDMLAVVSHELRTPLNAIQGWLHVRKRRPALDATTFAHALEVLQRNLDAQTQVVDDLLDTARIASGKFRIELHAIDVRQPVHAAVEIVRPGAEAKGVDLQVELPPAPVHVDADAHRLEQAVWNLLSNAVKFTPAGGHVAMRVWCDEQHASIEVADDGEGIDPAFVPELFERFTQGDYSRTRYTGGLGLGLALVRHIARAHGGEVHAESRGRGQGSRFRLVLPIAARAAHEERGDDEGAVANDERARPLENARVLLVEDHQDSRELLAEVLSLAGADVVEASDVPSARDAYRRMRHDAATLVLVCDIGLPGQSGETLPRQLRRLRENAHADGTPSPPPLAAAIAVSAFVRPEDRSAALEAGFDSYLSKPLSPERLIEALARIVHGDRTRHAQAARAPHAAWRWPAG